ncbi:MAG: hypothetical protein IPK19_41795 [Chloroflexi bacterium]|nr:hypothetical protein [Chloroflexota bacterium]
METGFATQVILNARLTRFYEREDWRRRLAAAAGRDPLLLERGISVELAPTATADASSAEPIAGGPSSIERAARAKLAEVKARAEQATNGRVAMVTVEQLRKRRQERQQERSRERMP